MPSRIQFTDAVEDALVKLTEGNPGALRVCLEVLKEGARIDPDNALGSMGSLLMLDTYRVYGPDIWIQYKDVCHGDLTTFLASIRARQLGLRSAWERVETVVEDVRAVLPRFGVCLIEGVAR